MHRLMQFLTDRRTLSIIAMAALVGVLYIGAETLQLGLVWFSVVLACFLGVWLAVCLIRSRWVRRAAKKLGTSLLDQGSEAERIAGASRRVEIEAIRRRMADAIATIKSSRLGQTAGSAALYELPWYMIIGNPAAGKSTAIAHSGLQFPFADQHGKILQGIGGTRNCDWFFTTDGIVLDTAGRYSVHQEDRDEWFGFLALLRKHRSKAPINGIIIAVSIAELSGNRPEFGIQLAKNLRQRVQELIERLEVFAPVYVMFTKADLIAGFTEFFIEMDRAERDRAWGATLPYSTATTRQDVLSFFDEQFDRLHIGLKEMSTASMTLRPGEKMLPGVLTFPAEFLSIKGALRSFIATLFEENPFQYKPVFRGFYFTSALQEGASVATSSGRIAERFGLEHRKLHETEVQSRHGFFLLNLFRNVIFADRHLVARFSSPVKTRIRYAAFFTAAACVGLSLAGWSWSYLGNRQLAENVQADLQKAVSLQEGRIDLQSRFEALEILQDRIEQLQRYRDDRPLALSFGLYQGELLERKLREEYFAGMREIMVRPVAEGIEAFLGEVNDQIGQSAKGQASIQVAREDDTTAVPPAFKKIAVAGVQRPYKEMSAASNEDGYNALKTYLMLADRSRAEASHLNDQLTRFWRIWLDANRGTMAREQMIRSAERLLSFHLAQIDDPSWPLIENNASLVEASRDSLRLVVRGMAARDRVYADIKARAATRFPAVTVARIVGEKDKAWMSGSHAVSGAFTRNAWEKFVRGAIEDAANRELQSADWVLKTAARDDLTLEGSPEQIQKALTMQYKEEYAKEWSAFLQGITVADLETFPRAVEALNRLADPVTSPIQRIVETVHWETSWDNPQLLNQGLQKAQTGAVAWFRRQVLGQLPARVDLPPAPEGTLREITGGAVGKEFAGVARLVASSDNQPSMLRAYIDSLAKLRSRLNQIRNQGDVGPGLRQLMQQTLDGSGSELADSVRYVDEQMLSGIPDRQRQAIRPLLVRPLMQAFAVIIPPTETELNRTWRAQVLDPFQKNLAIKYPFSPNARIEATAAEVALIFGPNGAIAKFVNASMGPLVVRRGDTLTAKSWADMGISITPALANNFAFWVAPAGSFSGGTSQGGQPGGSENQTLFQVQPIPAAGTVETTLEIDGQQLRYRNTQAQWTNFIWPNPQGVPGARITAVTYDGRHVEVVNFPGRFGLEKLINSAQRQRREHGVFDLSWSGSGVTVSLALKIISSPQVTAAPAAPGTEASSLRGLQLPATIAGTATSSQNGQQAASAGQGVMP